MADKVDSNVTALNIAEEESIRVLPATPDWYELEPNSYSDFGSQVKTVARKPITASRSRRKGSVVDLDASGGINQDMTFSNLWRTLQGFMFADVREKPTLSPMNGAALTLSGVFATADNYAGTGIGDTPVGFMAGHIILASGFTEAANNGVKVIDSIAGANSIVIGVGLANETPPAEATLKAVGYQFASATLNVTVTGSLVSLDRASGSFDFTTLDLVPGEWIFIGGDSSTLRFANNQGFARVGAVTASSISLDKVDFTAASETGTGKTIQIFFGTVLKNEDDPANIVRRTYQLERQLGEDDNGTMSEYLVGSVANELTLSVPQGDKVTMDLTFVAIDNEQRDGTTGVKSGNRHAQVAEEAYNTAVDFSRIKLGMVDTTDSNVTALFAYAMEMNIMVKNNASPNKAIGVLGGFDVSVGTFEVDGNLNVYFANMDAVTAVRNSSDVTLDVIVVKDNAGYAIDIPLLGLGDGRLNVELDKPIMLPLETAAAESSFGHTLLLSRFDYLPTLAG